MIDHALFIKLVNQFIENQTSHNTELTIDLMIFYQLLIIKDRYEVQEQSFNRNNNNQAIAEDLADLEHMLDSMIEKNHEQLVGILDLLKKEK